MADALNLNDAKSVETFSNNIPRQTPDTRKSYLKKIVDYLREIKNHDEFNTQKSYNLLRIILQLSFNVDDSENLTQQILDLKLIEVFKIMLNYYINLNDEAMKNKCIPQIVTCLNNISADIKVKQENLNKGIIKEFVDYIKSGKLIDPNDTKSLEKFDSYDSILCFLYNHSKSNDLKEDLLAINLNECIINEKLKLDQMSQKYSNKKTEIDMLKTRLVGILAYTLSDEELNSISLSKDIVQSLVDLLEKIWQNGQKNTNLVGNTKYYMSYQLGNIQKYTYASNRMDDLYRLAINDQIKEILFEMKMIPMIENYFLKGDYNEQRSAIELLCSLCFNVNAKNYIKNDVGLMNAIENKIAQNANNQNKDRIVDACKQIIEMTNRILEKRLTSAKVNSKIPATNDNSQHIMISYQHNYTSQCKALNALLKRKGYKTWIDFEYTFTNLHEGMAKAVENASIVLVCYADEYKNSNNCRLEAQYATDRNKTIIPIRLQRKFKPDGWLGLIVSGKFYLDLSNSTFDESDQLIVELLKNIEISLKPNMSGDAKNTPVRPPSAAKPVNNEKRNKIKNWAHGDIMNWLQANKLDDFKQFFNDYDGLAILALYDMKKSSENRFYDTIDSEIKEGNFKIALRTKLRFYQILDELI